MDTVVSQQLLLVVTDLKTIFGTRDGDIHAVNGISFHLHEGELLGIVGESGSGKNVSMMSLTKLLPMPPAEITDGHVMFAGRDLLTLECAELRAIRGGDIGFVFQDPMTSLNPVYTIGFQLIEPLRRHLGLTKQQARQRAAKLLDLVGTPSPADRLNDYPHQFSGGMRQRVMIAITLAYDPKILIADEPTTALDVTIQAQILELIRKLRQELGMAIIWITHDLGVVAGIADRVMVMYGGLVVEHAPVETLYRNPQLRYTRALLNTLPTIDGERDSKLNSISGQPPSLLGPLSACPFLQRCDFAHARCYMENPPTKSIAPGHDVACWWDMDKKEPRP